jgi:nucleotide-binding universal stress UspA family protein
MKTILVPVEDHEFMPAVLEAARLVARRFDGYVEGFAVAPAAADLLTVDPLSSLAISHHGESGAEIERVARELFNAFMTTHGVPPAPASPQRAGFSQGWRGPGVEADGFIGSHGRVFDLIVVGRPGPSPQHPRWAPLEAALFESGRPVLVTPAEVPREIGRNVLIAWNAATEQARTNAFAMPLLRQADEVTVLSVEGGMTPGPPGEDVARALLRGGVRTRAVTIARSQRSTGEAVLDFATAHGCDLLVKGAYTKSRLRQMIFGDATRHILANAAVPILMAY